MQCAIYKSPRKQDTYLYLAARDDFSCLPENLLKLLGEPLHVMDLDLHPDRQLAQENTVEVLQNLQERGWHLQMPRREEWMETNIRH
ncbi:MAG: YcgL domain-containing protein [Candidatus Competibacteraceae bacterium]|jgi:uncharacterized protein YcgL (UPF0745 family)